jgi:hypothetical protein
MGPIDYNFIFVVMEVTFWCSVKIQRCHVQAQEIIVMVEDGGKTLKNCGIFLDNDWTLKKHQGTRMTSNNLKEILGDNEQHQKNTKAIGQC